MWRRLPPGGRGTACAKKTVGLPHKVARRDSKGAGQLEGEGKSRNVLTALDLSHVRPLNACKMSKFFLRQPGTHPTFTHGGPKCLRKKRICCCGPPGSPWPPRMLIHEAEDRLAGRRKPRYL